MCCMSKTGKEVSVNSFFVRRGSGDCAFPDVPPAVLFPQGQREMTERCDAGEMIHLKGGC